MLAIKRTVLAQFELSLGVFTVLFSSIVLALTFTALHSNQFYSCFLGHFNSPLQGMIELPSGIEPLTSTLPWLRSAD